MATISHIQPLFQTHVVPLLTAMETRRFSISSKPALEMIQAAAKELQKDVTFPGERVLIKINPSITALLLQKLKMEALSDQSGFFDAINDLKACMKEENVDTEDIQLLFQYSFRSVPLWVSLYIVLFDYHTKKIPPNGPYSIGRILSRAILELSSKDVQSVFAHPHAMQIQAEGQYGLADVLGAAVYRRSENFVRLTMSFPQASDIPARDGYYGLDKILDQRGETLTNFGEKERKKLAHCLCQVVSHQNASKIPFRIINKALQHANYAKCFELEEAIKSLALG